MRVLHISSLYPPGVVGGAEKVTAMLAGRQVALGCTVAVAHLTRAGGPAHEQAGVQVTPLKSRNLLWIEDVQTHARPVTTLNKLLQAVNVWTVADLSRAIAAFRPDVVHTHSMVELPPLVWRAAQRSGAAVIHTLHDYDLLCSRATLFRAGRRCAKLHPACAALKTWKSVFAHDIDAVAAVSRPILDAHLRHGVFRDIANAHRRVIWNGVERRPVAGERQGPLTFGFLGRLVPEKGLGVLLEACRRLPSEGWRLRVAGRAPDGSPGFEADARGLPVEFLGFTEAGEFLSSVDVLVAPSIWEEPFGLTIVEAYAAGAAVIGSDRGAIGELVGSVAPQWVVPGDDPEALAVCMSHVLRNGRAALPGPEAFQAVLAAASPETMTSAYLELYGDVLQARALRTPAPRARSPLLAAGGIADAHPAP